MAEVEVAAGIGALIVRAAAPRVATADLQAATGFDPRWAEDPDAHIPLAMETALWDEAAARTGDPAFGIHTAEGVRPGVFDVMDYVFRTAPTLRAALERLVRYNRLLHDIAVITLVDEGPLTRLEHTLAASGATQSRHAAEFTLAGIVVAAGQMQGTPVTARAVEFRHASPAPAVIAEHRRVFGVTPTFGHAANALTLDSALLDQPLPGADPVLSRVVLRHADDLLAARPAPAETSGNRVRRLVAAALADGSGASATLAAAAAELHMSERSLQRRLADEGLTFDGLLEEVRREMAVRYLSDRKVAIAEVAYLLGYSEPSAFHRAFKRWTGKTPSEIRDRGQRS